MDSRRLTSNPRFHDATSYRLELLHRKGSFEASDVCFTPKSGRPISAVRCPSSAMCGRLRVGKTNLHVALLVGAAMCSAC